MKQFTARAYNGFAVNEAGHIVKSSSTERLKDEIDYYKIIKETDLRDYFPEVYLYIEKSPYSIEMEYIGQKKISQESLISQLQTLFNCFSEVKVPGSSEARRAMYLDKTLHYYRELMEDPFFDGLRLYGEILINGKVFKNFHVIWHLIEELIIKLLVNDDDFAIIHGDLCFSNILMGDKIKLVDPRGSFGKKGIWGDQLYDLAKLRHSYHGAYESIITDYFTISSLDNQFWYWVKPSGINFDYISVFSDIRVKLIEGLIFVGMCSRHYDSLDRQKAMYITGLTILNEVLIDASVNS